jgi:hypothetical protein
VAVGDHSAKQKSLMKAFSRNTPPASWRRHRPVFPSLVVVPLLICGLIRAGTAQAQSSYEPYAVSTIAAATPAIGGVKAFDLPSGMTVDSSGNLYVANTEDHTIRKVTATGLVGTLAGSAGSPGHADGARGAVRFSYPMGVAVDVSGKV